MKCSEKIKRTRRKSLGEGMELTKHKPLKQYITDKIKLLKDFKIILNADQTKEIKSLTSEDLVDRFAHDLIFEKLGKE
jgi:hypothetical protein